MNYDVIDQKRPELQEVFALLKLAGSLLFASAFFSLVNVGLIYISTGKNIWIPFLINVVASFIASAWMMLFSFSTVPMTKIFKLEIINRTFIVFPFLFSFVWVTISLFSYRGMFIVVVCLILMFEYIRRLWKRMPGQVEGAFRYNTAAGAFDPETFAWRLSKPIVRKSPEEDKKQKNRAWLLIPFAAGLGLAANDILGKNAIFLVLVSCLLMVYGLIDYLLYKYFLYKKIITIENKIGRNIFLQ